MDVSIISKKFVAGLVLLVLAFWYFPVGLLVVIGLLAGYKQLKKHNDKAGTAIAAKPSGAAMVPGYDPQAAIAALVSGVPERQAYQPRPCPTTTRPKGSTKAPARDCFA